MECLHSVRGLMVTASLGFVQIDMESDSLSVINALEYEDRALFRHLLVDI